MEGFKKEEIRKGPWKEEEDEVLINHVKKYGPRDWSSIRSKGLLHRTGKSCRLRWVNKLRPNLKSGCKFSAEEERVASGTPPSSSNSKQQKSKNKYPVFLDVPIFEALMFSSSMEEEVSSKACSSSYLENPEQIRMMPLPPVVKSQMPGYDANLFQYEPMSGIDPFPQIPQPQPDLVFSPESHELLARLDDPYFLNVLGTIDAPELGDTAQFSLGPPLFDPVTSCMNTSRDAKNPVTPDTLFDELPPDMFDHIDRRFQVLQSGEGLIARMFYLGVEGWSIE
ncbi:TRANSCRIPTION FACTOR DUO1 [Salix viminalis]|uniref:TRANSCRIPTION FACTOR DUO1 n=1 Tax=Salix viminalis TaxID=40686 RepID=A0A9Q0NTJ2_SALVM|nr:TRANSCRIPTION FACTOR DUO1 [Salix viminalis]